MRVEQYIIFAMTIAMIVICTFAISDEINHSKQHNERFDALVRDSVKLHKWFENWEENLQEKLKTKP